MSTIESELRRDGIASISWQIIFQEHIESALNDKQREILFLKNFDTPSTPRAKRFVNRLAADKLGLWSCDLQGGRV